MRAMVYIDADTYLDCRLNKEQLIKMAIAEKIKSLIIKYGIYLQFKISKVKHKFDAINPPYGIEPFCRVKCCLFSEEELYYDEYIVKRYLEDNWYDYAIDYEILKEEAENEQEVTFGINYWHS